MNPVTQGDSTGAVLNTIKTSCRNLNSRCCAHAADVMFLLYPGYGRLQMEITNILWVTMFRSSPPDADRRNVVIMQYIIMQCSLSPTMCFTGETGCCMWNIGNYKHRYIYIYYPNLNNLTETPWSVDQIIKPTLATAVICINSNITVTPDTSTHVLALHC